MKIVRVVAAVIREDDKIFATARGYGDMKGGWEFPGGKIEPGETPQAALKREIMEELDTEISVGELIDTIEYDYPKFHLSMDCFWCRVVKGELKLKEAAEARWLTKDELNSVPWLPADVTLIEKIKEQLVMKKDFTCMRDNLTIVGTEYRRKEGKLPAVILSHGYLSNQNGMSAYAELVAELGYAAFTFDFNGGGIGTKSSGKSVDMTVSTEVKDLKAVISYVKQNPDVDSENIILLGYSQGGVVSAITAHQLGGMITKLVLLYPAFCIPDDARAGDMRFAHFDPKNVPDIIQLLPMKLGGDYARCVMDWSIKDMVGVYEGEVLYLHGTKDDIVDIRYAREAMKEYSHVEYHEIEGGGHGFHGEYEQIAKEYITAFLSGTE